MAQKLSIAKTPAGKSKIVDCNGFSIATAAFTVNEKDVQRLVACWNALRNFSTEDIEKYEFHITTNLQQ